MIPGPPQITYNPSREVYDGTMLSMTCAAETPDLANTELVWLQGGQRLPTGEVMKRGGRIVHTQIIPALIGDTAERYECHVLHPNLPEPLVAYASPIGNNS